MGKVYTATFFAASVAATSLFSICGVSAQGAISDRDAKAISVAMPEFVKHGLDMKKYKATVFEHAETVYVIFDDIDLKDRAPVGHRGSYGKVPVFEVELSKDAARVMKSSFAR